MSLPAQRLIPPFHELYERICQLPEGVTGEILEPGVLRTMSRPNRRHARVGKFATWSLRDVDADLTGYGWWILVEHEIKLPDERLIVPDIAGWRVERIPVLPEENPLTVVPDWCCEILSPSTARDDRTLKLPLYAAHRIGWTWLVNPDLRTVEVFETSSGRPILVDTAKDDDAKILAPFASPIALADWWTPDNAL